MPLTPDAKRLLAETIRGTQQAPERGLRARLLRAIHDEADRRYRLSVPIAEAGLDEAHRRRRERIEAWIDERARATKPANRTELKAAKDRLLRQAEKEAAATLINRLVLLRHLEALGLSKPVVLTGGWNSSGYLQQFRKFAPTLCTNGTTDATEGYATLLQLLFDELATDLPGLFGDVGLTRLFAIPAATLRDVVERLDEPGLVSAWTDDTTLGWVYQYWNDPDREALDAKIAEGGKIEPHEIASKTQMFTERYMVEWLLQNSLGLTWLCICKKHGWTPDAERVLPLLETRRAEWRKKREAGEVALDALMPTSGELEDHWKYYVPQPIPEEAVGNAPESVRALKILDPACGSGHFLVIAFGLLATLYREEARHRGETITDREIAESILENNLHGIDIDPRAIQIAAAGLYLKAKSLANNARPRKVNLVAPLLQLGNLPPDDPAISHLRQDLKREVGIPEELTNKLLTSLAGVDYLGALLKVDAAVEDAIRSVELEFERTQGQGNLFGGFPAQQMKLSIGEAKATVLDKLEQFLAKHLKSEDLGLRLDGEQLAAGVRFVRMAREGAYDVVVGNPPYQGLAKTDSFEYVAKTYPRGRADLYAAFLERGLELVRPGGVSALLTMRAWMFLGQFAELRRHLIRERRPALIADLHFGAFSEMKDVSVGMTIVYALPGNRKTALALRPVTSSFVVRDALQLARNMSGLMAPAESYEFTPYAFEAIKGEPIVYWWSDDFLAEYGRLPKIGDSAPIRIGTKTSNNARFVRCPWELAPRSWSEWRSHARCPRKEGWIPFVQGAAGKKWFEPLVDLVDWSASGLAIRVSLLEAYGAAPQGEQWHLRPGIAFTSIGSEFAARAHRYRSVFSTKGTSAFPENKLLPEVLCLLNSSQGRAVAESLNPGIGFEVRDVSRIPLITIRGAPEIVESLDVAFSSHEQAREPSVEFTRPSPSCWRYAQDWAQRAVDRPKEQPLPPYDPQYDPPEPANFISFGVGVALGRFGANSEGILRETPATSLPSGLLFLAAAGKDSLDQSVCDPIHASWLEHGAAAGVGEDLRTYLRKSFFDYHKGLYENRPIYFPLSSAKKSFVAFIWIHRWRDDTLNTLLADHLVPAKRQLEGELDDLRAARAAGRNKGKAERRFTEVQKLLEELNDFITKVTEIAEKGPPPPDDRTPKREVAARHVMDLDDGVLVNSAGLWPLLEPHWKDPKKWWRELASAQGKKDYDWSHLAARYYPTRVRKKCHEDPSLAVAHKCFWELHPAKAYAWELRLHDEIRPDFAIDEPTSDAARRKFLADHAREAAEIVANEMRRRERKTLKAEPESEAGPLFERDPDEPEDLAR